MGAIATRHPPCSAVNSLQIPARKSPYANKDGVYKATICFDDVAFLLVGITISFVETTPCFGKTFCELYKWAQLAYATREGAITFPKCILTSDKRAS